MEKEASLSVNLKKCTIALLGSLFITGLLIETSQAKYLGNIYQNGEPLNFSTYWNQVTQENGDL
jgi:hypothetical protein